MADAGSDVDRAKMFRKIGRCQYCGEKVDDFENHRPDCRGYYTAETSLIVQDLLYGKKGGLGRWMNKTEK